jgi:hypothetical protein
VSTETDARWRTKTVSDVARTRGIQHITFTGKGGTGQFTVLVVGRTVYIRADASALRDYLALSAGLSAKQVSRYANRWISIPHNDPYHGSTAQDATLGSFIKDHVPVSDLTVGGGSVGGRRVQALRGWADQVFTRTAYVPSAANPLPLEFTDAFQARDVRERVVVGPWNRPVDVRTPAHAVPILTLESGG